MLAFLTIPGPFFGGLFLIPLGMWLKRSAKAAPAYLSAGVPETQLAQPGVAQAGLFRRRHHGRQYRDRQPVRLQRRQLHGLGDLLRTDLPHGDAAGVHRLSELAALARGMREVPHRPRRRMVREEQALRRRPVVRGHASTPIPRPIPTPVHNLRPARETCETCHWPQKYGEDRVRVITKFADDETNSLTKTVLLMKIGGGNHGIGIHGTHLGPGVHIRYAATDEQRQNIPWVEYNGPGRQTLYTTADAKPDGGGAPIREMDCMDCHNRPAHSYDLPDRGVDKAMAAGLISTALPFAKKKGVEILKANYLSRDEAAQKIPAAFAKYYQDTYPAICTPSARRRSRSPAKNCSRSGTATSSRR